MPYCASCRSEYEDGIAECAECGQPLEAGAMPPDEPTTEWTIVRTVGGEDEANLLCGFLRSQGLDAAIDSAGSHTFQETIGDLAGVRISVPSGQQAEAEKLLAEREVGATAAEEQELDAAAEAAGGGEPA